LKTRIMQSKTGNSILLSFDEGFSNYRISVPMPYAIRFFADGLLASLDALLHNDEIKGRLSDKSGEKAETQEKLRKSIQLYEQYLKESGR
jgi:hypothetical protein